MKKKSQIYRERRRKQLLEDNVKEEATIKKLTKKLGLDRRKPRKSGVQKQPAWMRESGLDYLLDFEKHDEVPVSETIEATVIGDVNIVKKQKISKDIYGQNIGGSESSLDDLMGSDSESEEMCVDSPGEEGDEDVEQEGKPEDSGQVRELVEHESASTVVEDTTNDEIILNLRRSVRRLLNCVSEAQMAKTISDLVEFFSDRPRAIVRQVLIEEIDILLGSFPLDRGQSVGWLQQELAVCLVSAQSRLDHSGQDSRLVAHFAEFLVSKLPQGKTLIEDAGVVASRCVFLSYLYRFGALTGDLVVDLVEEFVKFGDLSALQIAHQMVKPVGCVLRKEQLERCMQLVNGIKETISTLDQSNFEKIVELEGIVANLSAKHSKEPAPSSADHFAKMMRSWNKGISFSKEFRLPLRLEELRNAKGRGRWWAVGSAFKGDALESDSPLLPKRDESSSKKAFALPPELAEIASRLGLITPIRQQLFGVLVSTPGGPDCTANALILACSRMGAVKQGASEHREREMVQIVIHCLVSEQPFNRFYTRVLGALLNHHRRFGLMIRCAFWDVMAKDELTKEAKSNAGRAIGILASVFDFPLTLLKKFNFGDESEANVVLLSSMINELTNMSFNKTLEKFAYVANNSPKLGRNLRIFMRKLSRNHPSEACRSYLSRLVSDLRDLFP
uniref:MI domain-containing protein n=2 Tax=Mesocestoides corti TaxID=53468 RepID=A0A5K3F4C1_MESCO